MNSIIKKIAIRAIKKAGIKLADEYQKFDRTKVKLKSRHEIITQADLDSEKIIINEIQKNFPKHNIFSEEAGKINQKSDYLWIIDPLDGTTNFSMHNPLWSISMAVAYKKKIIFGIIFAPILEEFYVAEKDRGAKMNGKKIKLSSVLAEKSLNIYCHGSTEKNLKRAIKYYTYQKLHGLDCRQLGSAAIELAYVAVGRIESIVIPGANSYDVAAGALIVNETGGKVTDFEGKEWNLNSKDIVASSKKSYKNILKALKASGI